VISQCHNLVFYANIDDHVVCWGNTGQILAQWWRPVDSKVALDMLHWALCSALHRLIRMAIKMACKRGVFFSVVIFLS
jgi:hypothetical protein